jgi:hypothetical protein
MGPLVFDAPPINPAPNGLYAVTSWTTDLEPRWFDDGVEVRPFNVGGSAGVWIAPWNASHSDLGPDDVKEGERPDLLDPFTRMTVWGYDHVDVTKGAIGDVEARAQQNLRMVEEIQAEKAFAARMIADSPSSASGDIVAAVSKLEVLLGKANVVGFLHASHALAAYAAQAQLIVRTGTGLKTPLGHTWVFGGGYDEGLGLKVVATSQTFGWRTGVDTRSATDTKVGKHAAVAETSLVIGYEAVLGLVDTD